MSIKRRHSHGPGLDELAATEVCCIRELVCFFVCRGDFRLIRSTWCLPPSPQCLEEWAGTKRLKYTDPAWQVGA